MVSSTFLEQPGMKLELPSAKSSQPTPVRDLTLYITKNGEMTLNDKQITLEQLSTELSLSFIDKSEATLVIKADKDVSHGNVVKVMDISKRSGVKKLVIATKMEE
jgi:biopolymer transport protein ExbD